MVTAIANRGLGQPRADAERLMVHRGISMGEAEELLRLSPGGALLPQRGTGQEVNSPDARFVWDECYFPTAIPADEPFTPKWTILNQGDTGEIALGIVYKGEAALMWRGAIEAGAQITLTTTEPVLITQLVGEIERTQTIELAFVIGWISAETPEVITITITDRWDVAVYVEVGGAITTWWPWLLGGGVAVVGAGILVTRK